MWFHEAELIIQVAEPGTVPRRNSGGKNLSLFPPSAEPLTAVHTHVSRTTTEAAVFSLVMIFIPRLHTVGGAMPSTGLYSVLEQWACKPHVCWLGLGTVLSGPGWSSGEVVSISVRPRGRY